MNQLIQLNNIDSNHSKESSIVHNNYSEIIPVDILFSIFHYVDYSTLSRLSLVNRTFYQVGQHLMKHFPEHNRWAWANERLKHNQSAVRQKDRKTVQTFSMFLNRIGFKAKLEIQKGVLLLFIRTSFGKIFKIELMVLDKFNFFEWWLETERANFIPARLNVCQKNMDIVSCSLLNSKRESLCLVVDLSDPIDIKVIKEHSCRGGVFNPFSETYYLLPNIHFGSSFIKKSLLCPISLWEHKYESSDHPEYESLKWSMIRTHKHSGQTVLYLFEDNLQIHSVVLDCYSAYGGHGILKSVGAGKYVIEWQPIGNLNIFVVQENRRIIFDHNDIDYLDMKKILEAHLIHLTKSNVADLIILRDICHHVFVVDVKRETISVLPNCNPHIEYPFYVCYQKSVLNWIDIQERPKQFDFNQFV